MVQIHPKETKAYGMNIVQIYYSPPSHFTVNDTSNCFFFLSFAINLRRKCARWTLCSCIVHPFMFYHWRHCLLFYVCYKLKGEKILNPVKLMIQVHPHKFYCGWYCSLFFCLRKIFSFFCFYFFKINLNLNFIYI